MKLTGIIISSFLCVIFNVKGQKIHQVMYEDKCDVKIYLAEDESKCDLKVFFVDDEQKSSQPGCWYVCDFPNEKATNIYFTDDETQADVLIYIVDEEMNAGWVNEEKKNKMPLK